MYEKAIGLMSGTSVDGIDAALIEIDVQNRKTFRLVDFITRPFSLSERRAILKLCNPATSTVEDVCRWNFVLGELFADAALEVMKRTDSRPQDITVIGSHGQTIYHIPGHSSLQIGEPAVIASRTGVTTVADFRTADIAAHGQGAPLVPCLDQVLFGGAEATSAVQNIGGIGNVAVVGQGAERLPVVAFDTGPGNMIIDAVVEQLTSGEKSFDNQGEMAAEGVVDQALLSRLMEDSYFQLAPPKSTGRELFGKQFAEQLLKTTGLSGVNLVATVTAFTARSIADQYKRFILPYCTLDRIIVAGGGSHNATLLQMIKEYTGITVYTHEQFGVSSDAKEAIAFALMADCALRGQANNVPKATGAWQEVVMGKIVYPPEHPIAKERTMDEY